MPNQITPKSKKPFTQQDMKRIMSTSAQKNDGKVQSGSLAAKVQRIIANKKTAK